MGSSSRRHRRMIGGLAVTLGLALALGACSSDSSSKLTSEERTALGEAAAAFDQAEAAVVGAFEGAVVVPKLERWQETETRHQEALTRLRDGLPVGECRSAIDALLEVEKRQNVIRLRLIEDYRQEQFGLVAKDTTDYGVSVINGAYQAEDAVAVACGRSTVNRSRVTERAGSLSPAQNALIDAVLDAYDATRQAFDAAFSIPGFVADVEALQAADAAVAKELDEVIALLGDGECRASLVAVRALEQQQSDLRVGIIAAGKSGDAVKMFTLLGDYTAINSTSEPFMTARRAAVEACGADV